MSSTALARATRQVVEELAPLRFSAPVACVYNPLEYARRPHQIYMNRYGVGPKRAILLGMNPGPFGMAQTGVPFGEVSLVRDWLDIEAAVDQPATEHPKRPITGFDCARSEVSGRRLWSWCRARFGSPARFFADYYIHNYCPLVFMEESGRNLTPDKLKASDRVELFRICDAYLRRVVAALRPALVIGIGAFAEARARKVFAGADVAFGRLPHPSPASPAANAGWDQLADAAFDALDLAEDA